jgi:hypothetical protein
VGSDADASSLGLANSYTVSLFSSCAENNSSTTCTSAQFGYHFNPLSDLKLDDTGMQGSFSSSFLGSISYGSASKFIGIAYIFALLLTFVTQGLNILSCCAPRAIIASATTSILATIFLLAASSTAVAVFTKIKGQFNSELAAAGIKTALGNKLFIVSWIAFALLFLNSILLCVHHRRNKQTRQRGLAKGKGIIDHSGMDKSGGDVKVFAAPKRTKTLQLLKGIPMWNRHKYAQIEKQTIFKGVSVNDHDDKEVLVKRGFGGGEDEDDELVRGSTRSIPLQPLGNNGATRDVNTAYEPYRQTQ